jgi:IclR family KDG regulon transcriptional repressor
LNYLYLVSSPRTLFSIREFLIMNSVIKAFQVLDVFSLDQPELTFTEIVKVSGLGRTNTHKLLKTLVLLNCLAQDQKGGPYRLGPKLFELGSQFLAQLNLRRIAMPSLVKLAEEFEDTVYLCIEDKGEALCLERIDGPSPIKVTVLQRGGRLPLHAGAAPLALLSGMKDDKILKLMQKHDFEAYTENTVKNIAQLMVKVKETRKQGFSESWEDVSYGVASFGAPLRDSSGKVIGAISVGGLISRFAGKKKKYWIGVVKDIAQNISDKLGFI